MTEQQKNNQVQKSGDSSLNFQAQQIIIGPSLDEVRVIAQDIWNSNFYKLSSIAKDTAQKRAEEITNNFLDKVVKENPAGLNVAQDPDFQYSLFNAQKAYAKTGDKDLEHILVDLLVDRTKESDRNIKQIVLNECIETAPKLTKTQYTTLSIVFILKYTIYLKIISLEEFNKYIDHSISPFVSSLTKNNTCYQHLEYAGCGNIGIGSSAIEDILLNRYSGLFVKGFKKEDISNLLGEEPKLSQFIIKCLRDSNLLQISTINEETFRKLALPLAIESSIIDKLITVQKNRMMNAHEVKDFSIAAHPCMRALYDVWDNSSMKNITLTSVGIAIGHANIRRVVHEDYDLSIWINE